MKDSSIPQGKITEEEVLNMCEIIPLSPQLIKKIKRKQSRKRKGSILFCESYKERRDLYKLIIKAAYPKVITLSDGNDIFKKLQSKKVELIVMDVMLRGTYSADSLVWTIRQTLELSVPIIIISNLTSERLIDAMFILGINEYLIRSETGVEQVLSKIRTYVKK